MNARQRNLAPDAAIVLAALAWIMWWGGCG